MGIDARAVTVSLMPRLGVTRRRCGRPNGQARLLTMFHAPAGPFSAHRPRPAGPVPHQLPTCMLNCAPLDKRQDPVPSVGEFIW